VGRDAEAAAARFHGFFGLLVGPTWRNTSASVTVTVTVPWAGPGAQSPWLYGAVLYGWAKHIKLRSAAEADVCIYD